MNGGVAQRIAIESIISASRLFASSLSITGGSSSTVERGLVRMVASPKNPA